VRDLAEVSSIRSAAVHPSHLTASSACTAVLKHPSPTLSPQFFTCLVILFACEVAAGIWGFVNKDQVRQLHVLWLWDGEAVQAQGPG